MAVSTKEILDKGRGTKDDGETFGHEVRTMAERGKIGKKEPWQRENTKTTQREGKLENGKESWKKERETLKKKKKIETYKHTGNVGKWGKKLKELMSGGKCWTMEEEPRLREKQLAME
jgi:hypothetical protein